MYSRIGWILKNRLFAYANTCLLYTSTTSLVARVSCKEVITYPGPIRSKRVVLIDCGVRHSILRFLISKNIEIIRVPWDYDFNDGSIGRYDGLLISSGPGNPEFCTATLSHIRHTMTLGKPIFGICMGHQLLAMAAGAKTFKLKYGHRSHNQPVKATDNNRCYITAQNHGYAVDTNTPVSYTHLDVYKRQLSFY